MYYRRIDYAFIDGDVPKVDLSFDNGCSIRLPIEVLAEVLKRYESYEKGQKYEQDKETYHKMVKTLDGVVYNTDEDF